MYLKNINYIVKFLQIIKFLFHNYIVIFLIFIFFNLIIRKSLKH